MNKLTLHDIAVSGDSFLIEKAIAKIRGDIIILSDDLLNEEDRKKRLILRWHIEDLEWKIRYLEDPTSPEFNPPDYDDYDDEPCTSSSGLCKCCGECPDSR
jgi:hypothetical protein